MEDQLEHLLVAYPEHMVRCASCRQAKHLIDTVELKDGKRVCENGVCDNERYKKSGTDF